MRVAHVNLSREFRGGECQTLALLEAIRECRFRNRVQQIVIARRESPMARVCLSLPEVELRAVRPNVLSAVRALAGADVAHIHEGRSVQVGALGSTFGVPFVVTRRILKRPKRLPTTRWCYGRAAEIVCVSKAVARVMRDYVPTADLSVIPDCVRKFPGDPTLEEPIDTRRFVVAMIGELDVAAKRQDALIEAARSLWLTHPDMEFWIIGQGKDDGRLKDLARGLDHVRFFSWVPNLADYLARVDVLAHPADSEAFGSVMLEAMAAAVPVVAADAGGIPELVRHEHNGLLFHVADPDGLVAALKRIAGDPDLRARLSRNATLTADRYSPQLTAEQYYSAYLRALGRAAERPTTV